jgi:hypothetical protein
MEHAIEKGLTRGDATRFKQVPSCKEHNVADPHMRQRRLDGVWDLSIE